MTLVRLSIFALLSVSTLASRPDTVHIERHGHFIAGDGLTSRHHHKGRHSHHHELMPKGADSSEVKDQASTQGSAAPSLAQVEHMPQIAEEKATVELEVQRAKEQFYKDATTKYGNEGQNAYNRSDGYFITLCRLSILVTAVYAVIKQMFFPSVHKKTETIMAQLRKECKLHLDKEALQKLSAAREAARNGEGGPQKLPEDSVLPAAEVVAEAAAETKDEETETDDEPACTPEPAIAEATQATYLDEY